MKRCFLFCGFLCLSLHAFEQERNVDYFLSTATANSPLIKDYQNQVLLLSLDSQILRAALKPQVNGISNDSYAPVIGGWGYDNVITNGQQISGMISASKSFFTSKTFANQVLGLNIQGQQAINNSALAKQDLKKLIIDQYI